MSGREPTPAERSLWARVAAFRLHSRYDSRNLTANAHAAFLDRHRWFAGATRRPDDKEVNSTFAPPAGLELPPGLCQPVLASPRQCC